MPTFTFTPADDLEQTVNELINRIKWLTAKLDSKNVKRLDTNETVIKSQYGETYINGPLIQQWDMQEPQVLRLQLGYDHSVDKFTFEMWDALGDKNIYLNDNGEAVFAGNVNTKKSAYIGDNVYIGTQAYSGTEKLISFFNRSTDLVDLECGIYTETLVAGEYSMYLKATSGIDIAATDGVSYGGLNITAEHFSLQAGNYDTVGDSDIQFTGNGNLAIMKDGISGNIDILNSGEGLSVSHDGDVSFSKGVSIQGVLRVGGNRVATESYVISAIADHVLTYHI